MGAVKRTGRLVMVNIAALATSSVMYKPNRMPNDNQNKNDKMTAKSISKAFGTDGKNPEKIKPTNIIRRISPKVIVPSKMILAKKYFAGVPRDIKNVLINPKRLSLATKDPTNGKTIKVWREMNPGSVKIK
jgi:hypothetical protein